MMRFSETAIFNTLDRFQYVLQRFFESNSAIFENIETLTKMPGINGKVRHFWSNFQGFVGILADIKRGCSYDELPEVVANLQSKFEELMYYAAEHARKIQPNTMTEDTYQRFLEDMATLSIEILKLHSETKPVILAFKKAVQSHGTSSPMQFWREQDRQAQETETPMPDLRHSGTSTNAKVAASTEQ